MSNKALTGIPVFYINVDGSHDRNLSMLRQFKRYKINNYYRVSASTPDDILISYRNTSMLELACLKSHILAIKMFIDKTSAKYALICEDDADISNIEKVKDSILSALDKNNVQCLQASVSLREENSINIAPHKKDFFEFGAIAYFIERSYAQNLLDTFIQNETFSLDKFSQSSVADPRGGTVFVRPVADHVIYDSNTITLPIFSILPMVSEIGHDQQEDFVQVSSSIEKHSLAWGEVDTINIDYIWDI